MKPIYVIAFILPLLFPAGAGAYEIYIIDPPITNHVLVLDEPLPTSCQKGDTISIMAAPGEYEPASFVIQTATDEHLDNVRMACSKLVGDYFDGGGNATIAASAVDIRLAEWQVAGVQGIGNAVTPCVLVHDPDMLTVVEEVPDYYANMPEERYVSASEGGIIPDWGNYPETIEEWRTLHAPQNRMLKKLIDTKGLRPVDISKCEQFWITVHIPEDVQPANYTATLRIVPSNAPAQTLRLNVWVPNIKLLPPRETYSIYYASMLDSPESSEAFRQRYGPITETQMVLELENMLAHGCTNPNIYEQVGRNPDGSLDFSKLEAYLHLREAAGLPRGELFIGDGAVRIATGLGEGDYERNTEAAREIQAWATARGYGRVGFAAGDEWGGEKLRSEHEAMKSVEEAGGFVWVACPPNFAELVGDVLDTAIVQPPDSGKADRQQHTATAKAVLLAPDKHAHWHPESTLTPEWQDMIKGVHERGKRLFTYMDPWGCWPLPDDHRRTRGFGMWLSNIDGTMPWSYAGIHGRVGSGDFVRRGDRGVLDTISWEAYREGYDDSRYIATLIAAGGEAWLKAQDPERIYEGNLDELRRDVAEEILRLKGETK